MKHKSAQTLFERILFTTIALLLVLVVTTGWSVYNRLSAVSDSPLPSEMHENRRFLTRELNNNLLKSDNLCYAYLYQENTEALLEFEILQSQTERKLMLLTSLGKSDTLFLRQMYQLDTLVKNRFANLDTLMGIKNEKRVDETMRIVANEVEQAALETNLQLQIKQAAIPSKEEPKRKWFQRKKKSPAIENQVNATEIVNESAKKIANKLNKVRTKAVNKEDFQNSYKYTLEQRNNSLTKQINQIFTQIELAEKNALIHKTVQAKKVAEETNQIILSFSSISSVFIVLIVVLIITLFRKSKHTTLQLKLAKEKSDSLTVAKSRFLATMSHEIRTPLNAISGFTNQLSFEKLPSKAASKVGIIQSAVEHLVQITNEILDLSKLEKNEIHFEQIPFNPNLELKTVIDQFQLLFIERNNTFHLHIKHELPNIVGDPLRFRQILINLISNANKFTKEGTIDLTAEISENDNSPYLVILVADTGIGIEMDQLERIFEPFEQADESVTRYYGGTGLGLSITKRIMDKINGSITVESKPNQGSLFTLTIPITIAKEEVDSSKIPTQTSFEFLAGKTVLIADDEPFNRTLIKSMVHPTKLNLLEADNGLCALKLIQENKIDLALLDVRMPKMNGHDLVKEIVKSSFHFPIVGLTATLTPEKREEMILSGWSDVLTKPIQPNQLKQVIQHVLQKNQIHFDHIDLTGLKALTNNNEIFYQDLIDTFIQSTEKGFELIQEALANKDWNLLGDLAHQYAAPFKHFEATNCYATLKELEQMGKTKSDNEQFQQLVDRFIIQAKSIIEQVKTKR